MAPHSCPKSLTSAILHKRSASSQTVYNHKRVVTAVISWDKSSPVSSSNPKSNGYNDHTINILNLMPLKFKHLQGHRRTKVPPVCIKGASASSDTLQKQTCILGSHELGQPSFILHKIFSPHLCSAVEIAAGPHIHELDGVRGSMACVETI